jgi:hypothetical protein
MGKVFVGRTNLKLVLETNVDITEATTKQIKYQKPNSTEVLSLEATVEGVPSEGNISYDFKVADTTILDTEGTWKFWVHVVFSDGRLVRGKTTILQIYSV